MRYVLGVLGILAGFALMKYRQQIGDAVGEAEWMRRVGGVYNFMFVAGIFVIFWSIAYMTGTTNILFTPVTWLFPKFGGGEGEMDGGI